MTREISPHLLSEVRAADRSGFALQPIHISKITKIMVNASANIKTGQLVLAFLLPRYPWSKVDRMYKYKQKENQDGS